MKAVRKLLVVRELAVVRIMVLEIVEVVRVQVVSREHLVETVARMEHLETKQMVQRQSRMIRNLINMKLPLSTCFIKTMEKQKQTKQMKKRQ